MIFHFVMVPLIVWVAAQTIKMIIDIRQGKPLHVWTFLIISGGFPSSHSAVTSSLLAMVGRLEGIDSLVFLIVLVFSLLLRYDAMNVRYQAGKHAILLNQMRYYLQQKNHGQSLNNSNLDDSTFLYERLGHTPIEVIGGIIFGALVAILLLFFQSSYPLSVAIGLQ